MGTNLKIELHKVAALSQTLTLQLMKLLKTILKAFIYYSRGKYR